MIWPPTLRFNVNPTRIQPSIMLITSLAPPKKEKSTIGRRKRMLRANFCPNDCWPDLNTPLCRDL